ncbi:unnamed protein product [Closterium sp. Yama58-4]|nr:unnamed protein product [Closterium sp. Yama58-4]
MGDIQISRLTWTSRVQYAAAVHGGCGRRPDRDALLVTSGHTGLPGDYHLGRSKVEPPPRAQEAINCHVFRFAEKQLELAQLYNSTKQRHELDMASIHLLKAFAGT